MIFEMFICNFFISVYINFSSIYVTKKYHTDKLEISKS